MSCIEDLFLKMEEHEKYFSAVLHLVFPLQELEIVIGDEHISFTTSKIGSLVMIQCYFHGNYEPSSLMG